MHRFPIPLTLIAIAIAAAAPLHAQDSTADIDKVFSFATSGTPGCGLGLSVQGKVLTRAWGLADVEHHTPLTTQSKFDIGSTQKQFTAASILLLAQDGRLRLSDDIHRFLPELPDYGHTITINHLLTHTSGVRDWTALLPLAPEGTDVLKLIMRQRGLNFVPGDEWSYSNSGFELLKEIVARVSGMSFADFTRTRLFEPLGMTSSAYVPDILQGSGERAIGYQKEGNEWTPFMRLGNERGGGALISTTGDLLRWNDALTEGKLGKFVAQKIEETAVLNNGRKINYARGLMVDMVAGDRMVSHSGGAAGYSTWLGRFPDRGLSLVVMCNFDPVSATNLAGRVADMYLPPVDKSVPPPGPVAAPGVDATPRAGLFLDDATGEPMLLTASNGRLTIVGGVPLVPVSADRFQPQRATLFYRSQDAFEMRFTSNDAFEITSMEGRTTRYQRAAPPAMTTAQLQEFDGRYTSDEIGADFIVSPASKGVAIKLVKNNQSLETTPIAPDTFMQGLAVFRFRRDAKGRVIGLDYSKPGLRGVRFVRAADR